MTRYKTFEHPEIVQAIAHPLRAKMLYALQEREASPKELAAHFGVPLANVAYHIQVLRKLKLIRLVRKTRRRGAVQHYYIVDRISDLHNDAWSETPDLVKERVMAEWLRDLGKYATEAAATGGFNRANAHFSRSRIVLDQQGWDYISAKLDDVIAAVAEAEKASVERLKRVNHTGEIRTGVVMMLLESAPGVPGADEARGAGPSEAGEHPAHSVGLPRSISQ